ncbi:MAG: DMT family transporter [Bdellovibrionaceae bacterium]|nr:DMT family transporter [Pseudobdellovibrionaceae bacterium]MBX3033298.1 DMT family transporter [Pseudobdellovibrionaceae bacterium]
MSPHWQSILFASGASFSFATASVVYARFSQKISPLWMNSTKALVCWLALALTLLLTSTWIWPEQRSLYGLLGSGALGLALGDLFLLGAFARIGASRTLMVFGFQPLIMTIAGALLFGQPLHGAQGLGILFFMACLFFLSFERYRDEGRWEWQGLVFALIGVLMDNAGILLTRWSFDLSPALEATQANFLRATGALMFFALLSRLRPIGLIRHFRALNAQERGTVLFASLAGTFLSLSLYLQALKVGHLASLSAIVLTGPFYSGAIECWVRKKAPSRFLVASFVCLLAGMSLVLFSPH